MLSFKHCGIIDGKGSTELDDGCILRMRVDNTMYDGKGSTELEMYDGYAIRYTCYKHFS